MTLAGLIAVDFDGTLLRDDGTISERTLAILQQAREQQWLVVGATGRPPPLATLVSDQVPPMSHLITSNGSLTLDLTTDATIDQVSFSAEDAVWAGTIAREMISDAAMAVDHMSGDQTWEAGFGERVPNPPIGDESVDVLAGIDGEVRKILVWSDEVSLAELRQRLSSIEARLDVTHSGLDFLEIGPRGVSKASALQRLCVLLAVPEANRIAFGDALNDHEMLRWASTGVAMGNADVETQGVADDVTASNEDDGIAQWIERHILRGA